MVSGLMSPSPSRKRCNADLVVDFLRATPLKLASINEATKKNVLKFSLNVPLSTNASCGEKRSSGHSRD
jgi:hypothetical protein